MAAHSLWTTEFLSDSVWAFKRLLVQAPQDRVDLSVRESWHQVQQWVELVEPLLLLAEPGQVLDQIPPLQLTQQQLDALLTSAQAAMRSRPGLAATRPGQQARHERRVAELLHPLEHLHQSLRHLKASSWAIGIGLLCIAALDAYNLVVYRNVLHPTIVLTSVGAVGGTGLAWIFHHFRSLNHHAEGLYAHFSLLLDHRE